MLQSIFLACALIHIVSGGGKDLPSSFPVCKRKDPNVNDCVKNALQKTLPALMHGNADLGIPNLDPLKIDHIDIDKKKNDGRPVDIDLTIKDVQVTGIASASVSSAVADWDNGLVSFEMSMKDPCHMWGKYITDGTVLVLPITGTGDFDIKIENFKIHMKVHGTEATKDGDKYFMVDRVSFTFDADHMVSKYDNLFNGNQELGDKMNKFLNDNWRDILTEMTPSIEASYSVFFKSVAEKVFNQVPIDKIALP